MGGISAVEEAVLHAEGDVDAEELDEMLALDEALDRGEPDALVDFDKEPRSLIVGL